MLLDKPRFFTGRSTSRGFPVQNGTSRACFWRDVTHKNETPPVLERCHSDSGLGKNESWDKEVSTKVVNEILQSHFGECVIKVFISLKWWLNWYHFQLSDCSLLLQQIPNTLEKSSIELFCLFWWEFLNIYNQTTGAFITRAHMHTSTSTAANCRGSLRYNTVEFVQLLLLFCRLLCLLVVGTGNLSEIIVGIFVPFIFANHFFLNWYFFLGRQTNVFYRNSLVFWSILYDLCATWGSSMFSYSSVLFGIIACSCVAKHTTKIYNHYNFLLFLTFLVLLSLFRGLFPWFTHFRHFSIATRAHMTRQIKPIFPT